MGFRFRKSFKIAPGVKLNLGKKSAGVSVGGKGFRKSFSTSGRSTTSVGVPGTGLSYVSTSDNGSSKSKNSSNKGSVSNVSSSNKKSGCWIIAIPILIILFIVGGIASCVDENSDTVKSATGIEEIEFSDSEPIQLYVGKTDHGHINVECDDELNEENIVFVSSDNSVVTISLSSAAYSRAYYEIKAIGAGSATVHVETSDGIIKSEEISVTVLPNKITNIEFSDKESLELEVGATEDGYVNVECDGDFIESDVVFVSSDESVVTVSFDSKGYTKVHYDIEAIGAGTAVIYAQSADGTVKSEEISISVFEKETIVENTNAVVNSATSQKSTNEETEAQVVEYVLNTSRMKIHYKSCPSVKDIAAKNYAETNDYDGAIADGYSPCGRCNP